MSPASGSNSNAAPRDAAPAFSLRDLALVARMTRRRCGRVIDEETPVGAYVRELERSVAALEGENAE